MGPYKLTFKSINSQWNERFSYTSHKCSAVLTCGQWLPFWTVQMKDNISITVSSAGQRCSEQQRLAGRWPLGSLCRWPCENEYIFAALRWCLPALFCLLPVSWMVWEWAPYCPPYRRRCDEWGHGGCSLPWHVTHQWQNPPWSCSPPETGLLLGHHGVGPAGTSLTGAPEEYLACVEAGTEHTSAGPNWNYSRTSDLIFLQEQMKAMWQLFTTCL